MQGLVHGRRSVRGHPKERSKLIAWSIRTFSSTWKVYVRRRLKCATISTLLDPEGCSGDCISKGSQSSDYLRDAFDEVTKVIQLANAKLGSRYLSTGQEDAEASTLEEYATVLPFELSGTSGA
ncbi:hypothetical protein B296_00012698 [Ensete ventricosum]|uniref:Uncharacterized protein n=1 Tax=Ensete ventricosum TaxID=4639 RepID=A0A426ZFZ0_ENSVE|nr:hypothetical protein B296_00012698 [Ensete ventricosum]